MAKRSNLSPTFNPYDREIRRLEDALWFTRRALIDQMDSGVKKVLDGYPRDLEPNDVWRWAERAAEQVVEFCTELEQETYQGYPVGSPRALCPLCKHGTSGPYAQGFALPEGLIRHLLGSHNSRQCAVFGAAVALAQGSAESPFKGS